MQTVGDGGNHHCVCDSNIETLVEQVSTPIIPVVARPLSLFDRVSIP